jgi:hypothetical protein
MTFSTCRSHYLDGPNGEGEPNLALSPCQIGKVKGISKATLATAAGSHVPIVELDLLFQSRAYFMTRRLCGSPIHVFAQAVRTHVSPNAVDKLSARLLVAGKSDFGPSSGRLTIGRPDGKLFFLIHDDFKFFILPILHIVSTFPLDPKAMTLRSLVPE